MSIFKEILELVQGIPKLFNKYEFTFDRKQQESEGVWSFFFSPEKSFSMKAGEHIMLSVPHKNIDNRGKTRIFSPSSAPFEGDVRITFRHFGEESSSYKQAMFKLQKGDIVTARGPIGKFTISEATATNHTVFITGGIGVTPIRSLLLDMDHRNLPINATLLYGNRDHNFIFMEEFEQLARKHTGLQIRKFVSPTHIEKEDVKNATESDKDMFFIAGKPGFVKSFEGILRELGVSGSRIKADKFKAMRGRGYE